MSLERERRDERERETQKMNFKSTFASESVQYNPALRTFRYSESSNPKQTGADSMDYLTVIFCNLLTERERVLWMSAEIR